MAARIEVIGVYQVPEAKDPVSLVELWIRDFTGTVDFGGFSQKLPDLGASDVQVAYMEHLLNEEGTSGEELPLEPLQVTGDARVAFSLHFLDAARPIQSPFGPVKLPLPVARPARLRFIEYWQPD